MFMGITAHTRVKQVDSYETARAALERASRTPKGRQRTEKRWGYHLGANRNHGVTWVRECCDGAYEGAIAFRLYDIDVVTWLPDNSVEIDNYGTVTTSAFAQSFLPAGIWLNHPTERRGVSGGHRTISYIADPDAGYASTRVCHGDVVRFVPQANGSLLPDEETCSTMTLPTTVPPAKARELSRRYHLREFENWLSMAPQMLGSLIHERWDLETCRDALELRDFKKAAEFLPLVEIKDCFGLRDRVKPLPIATYRGEAVTMTSLRKLKLALWEDAGLLGSVEVKTVSRKTFDRAMARVRELDALGFTTWTYGPDR